MFSCRLLIWEATPEGMVWTGMMTNFGREPSGAWDGARAAARPLVRACGLPGVQTPDARLEGLYPLGPWGG